MSKIKEAVQEIHHMDAAASKDNWLNQIHPLPKLLVTIGYILVVVSFHKYQLTGLLGMILYPMVMMTLADISIVSALKRLKVVLLLVCFVGIANPLMDHSVMFHAGNIVITGGMISMVTVMLKGVLAVLASYMLIVSTSIESICYALRMLHLPKTIVTIVMLIYRYSIVLLKEVERMSTAYAMRAPGQKGIHYKAWGSMIGQLLLRSMDRGQVVYESMMLRGYDGEFVMLEKKGLDGRDVGYLVLWIGAIIMLRVIPVFEVVGSLF